MLRMGRIPLDPCIRSIRLIRSNLTPRSARSAWPTFWSEGWPGIARVMAARSSGGVLCHVAAIWLAD